MLLAYAIIVPVFAYIYFYRTETAFAAGIALRTYDTPTMKLGFYWDAACTQNVTSFDFGNITHPAQETILWTAIIWIRNEGSVWNNIYWNSTLASVNTQITESWPHTNCFWNGYQQLNGTGLNPGDKLWAWYGIMIPAYAAVGTFNWTLTVWGENYY